MKKVLTKAQTKFLKAKTDFMMMNAGVRPEVERGDHLIEILGVILIVVVILIFFKDKVSALFENMMGKTTDSVNGLFTNIGGSGGGGGNS